MLFRYMLKRRSLRLHYFRLTSSTVAAVLRRTHSRKRRVWMKDRVSSWWDNELSDEDWIDNFRMTEKSFDKLCEILKSDIKPHTLTVREPIPLRKRIAIALFKIGTCADYQTVANRFGVHKSSVHNYLYKFCEALIKHMDRFIQLPDSAEIEKTTEIKYGLSNVWGVVDFTHIPIVCPVEESKTYMNSEVMGPGPGFIKQSFRHISCDIPGGHELTAFQTSKVYTQIENISGNNSSYIVGNRSHPLCPKVIKEFTKKVTQQSKLEKQFNKCVQLFRRDLCEAFSLLRGRWRILLGRIDIDYTFAPTLIAVCCILHNFCIIEDDQFQQRWSVGVDDMENTYTQPKPKLNTQAIGNAKIIRNNLI
uniref:Uncharacterized protein n=1 Tax=Strigamia maritima TaxID=126957 RepID=T1J855_STRMM